MGKWFSRDSGGKGGQQPYTVSFFGTLATAAAVMLYLFSTTWNTQDQAAFVTMFLVLIAGIVLSFIFVGFKLQPFSFKTVFTDLIAAGASFIAVYYVNTLVGTGLSVSVMSATAFAVLAGVAEEWFFRMWLCAWIHKTTHSYLLAVPVSSLVWAIFHLARYGSNMSLIWLVFLAGLPLGFFTLLFRSADGPMFGHMLVNFFAS